LNFFDLENPSRRRTVKILAIGNYLGLGLDMVQGLAFIPLYISILGEKLYGLWLGTGGIIAIMTFLDMGIATLTIQRISTEYGKRNFKNVGLFFYNGLLIHICFMVLLLIAGILLSFSLKSFFIMTSIENIQIVRACQIAIFALVISLLNNTIEGTLNALQKPLFGKISQLVGSLISIITTYVFLISGYSLLSISLGLLMRALFSTIPNLFYLLEIFKKNGITSLNFSSVVIKDYLSLSPSIFLSKLGGALAGNIEPTLIAMFISPQASVYYSITSKAGTILKSFFDRLNGILFPSFSHLYATDGIIKLKELILKLLKVLFPVMISVFATYFLINKSFITIWVGIHNYLGDLVTLLISISLILSFLSNLFCYMLTTLGEIKYSNNVFFFESLFKVLLLYIFLKFFGVIGLSLAVIVTSSSFIVVYGLRWNKFLKIGKADILTFGIDPLKNLILIILVTSLAYLAFKIIIIKSLCMILLITGIILALFFIIFLYYNRFIMTYIKTNMLNVNPFYRKKV
jgi:O-antigen/teichoic acid export membrane protein